MSSMVSAEPSDWAVVGITLSQTWLLAVKPTDWPTTGLQDAYMAC